MKRTLAFLMLSVLIVFSAGGIEMQKVAPVKNVILLIPDGTSLATVSLARWLMNYESGEQTVNKLAIDPYICGTVITHSSNAPIGDSAPTTSCYMTGYPSLTGFVSTYPPADPENDIYPVDPTRAYRPLTTVLEAARWKFNKATGLVVTCEYPHATPADCAAHSWQRDNYKWISPQMVHNNIDVVIGGGAAIISEKEIEYLKGKNHSVYLNDIEKMRNDKSTKMWALFGKRTMSYEIDRDPAAQPSLEEMTRIALGKLDKSKEGFFLMVEGSRIDHAAHDNDPATMAREMLAFDKACRVAFEFAKKNKNTAIVILPDHGNSGISIGVRSREAYDRLSKKELFGNLSKYRMSASELALRINPKRVKHPEDTIMKYTGIRPTRSDIDALNAADTARLKDWVSRWMTAQTFIGFTTGGHTGEEVFLAAWHPQGHVPSGVNTNVEINAYLCALLGLSHKDLDALTEKYYAPDSTLFDKNKYDRAIITENSETFLKVTNRSNKREIRLPAHTNLVIRRANASALPDTAYAPSVAIHVDVNKQFYINGDALKGYLDKP
ncbi:MAG: alkaline phosphatase [Tannerellaceae bacterium]|nr:alkaline phosphatase [Tannerellaceae bacterium]